MSLEKANVRIKGGRGDGFAQEQANLRGLMAGHSQFKNIMYRKGAQDAKRAKIFTKIIRELTVSAKMGGAG